MLAAVKRLAKPRDSQDQQLYEAVAPWLISERRHIFARSLEVSVCERPADNSVFVAVDLFGVRIGTTKVYGKGAPGWSAPAKLE